MNGPSPSFKLIELTMDFPWQAFRPSSITLHFEESIITGTREISGSPAIKFKNRRMAASESINPSSMLTSMIWAPFSIWLRATSSAAS